MRRKRQVGVEGHPEDFGVATEGEWLPRQGDARVQPGLVSVPCELCHMGLRQRDFEAPLHGPVGDVGGMVSQAPGSFWYGWGCGRPRKIIGVGGVEVCGVGVIGYEEVEQDR